MALTSAERSKRYREKIKQNKEKHEIHRKKELKRLQKHTKKIKDLTEEEKEMKRKLWREQKRKQKERKKRTQESTPTAAIATTSTAAVANTSAAAVAKSTNLIKIKYRNLNRKYILASKRVDTYKTALNNIRKKLYREKKQHEKEMNLLRTENEKLKARQEVMEIALREGYIDCKKQSEKRIIKEVALRVAQKVNKRPDRKLLGLRGKVRKPNLKKRPLNKNIAEEFKRFFCRDDVSRSTAGKRETRTKDKKKVQIRYLVDTLRNIYQFYKHEGGKYSFTTLVRYKPFYVLSPSATTRNTCMCIKHSNFEFVFNALKLKGVIPYKNTTELLDNIACDTKSYDCMHNKCHQCQTLSIPYNKDKLQGEVTWFKWGRVDHNYEKSGQKMTTKKTTKQKINGTIGDLTKEFENQAIAFKTHYFNWKEQQRQYRACINNMKDEEIGILCDFSENYECKYSEEVQSTHFGASKNSITLHCGVILGKERIQSFVTISDENCHEPHAIWAHLTSAIKLAKVEFPNFKTIHFFSDGPTTQYRQKKNFYLLSLFTQLWKLNYSTWSFSEAGHGKSMADGVGGSVKRQLDKRVSYGQDITNATEACQVLQSTMKSVKCFYVSEGDVQNIKKLIPDDLRAVPGTMQLHQIISTQVNQIQYRHLSCFCGNERGLCSCYQPKIHLLTDQLKTVTEPSESTLPTSNDVRNEEPVQPMDISQNPVSIADSSPETSTILGPSVCKSSTNWLLPTAVDEMEIKCDESDFIDPFDAQILNTGSLTNDGSIGNASPLYGNPELVDCSYHDVEILDDVSIVVPPQITYKYSDVPQTNKRVKIHKPYDNENLILSPIKKVKIPVPSAVSNDKSYKKSLKILKPKVENDNQMNEKKTSSTSRTFPCYICKTRQQFILQEMAKCMVCHKWVCISCSGTTSFDYICPVCLSG